MIKSRILCFLFLTGPLLAIDLPPSGQTILPVEQVRPGMTGLTYTVLQGSEIVALKTEILGVAKNWIAPGVDLIVAKLVDDRTSLTGAVHGMSGSPLYIEGKLVGALSYSIADLAKDGQCGYTPIAAMLKVKDLAEESSPDSGTPLFQLPGLLPPGLHSPQVSPLMVPLSVGGVRPDRVEELFHLLGFKPDRFLISSGGAASPSAGLPGSDSRFEPQAGSPLAAVLMSGDIHFAGTGTCTWRQGNRVVAFGHPMFGQGKSAMGLAGAEIVTTVPSYLNPYKLSNTGPILGTVDQDRGTAISGIIGSLPALAPYRVERMHNGQKQPDLTGEIVPHPVLSPALVGALLEGALEQSIETARVLSIRMSGEIDFEGHSALQLNGLYSGEDTAIEDLKSHVLIPLIQLYQQDQAQLVLSGVHLIFHSRESAENWTIESLQADAATIEPGTPVHLTVHLREAYGATTQQNFTVELPENLRSGRVILRVGAAADLDEGKLFTKLQQARDVDEMIQLYNQRRQSDRLYLQVIAPTPGEVVRDQEMPALPGSILAVMQGGNSTEPMSPLAETVFQEQSVPLGGVLKGRDEVAIHFK